MKHELLLVVHVYSHALPHGQNDCDFLEEQEKENKRWNNGSMPGLETPVA